VKIAVLYSGGMDSRILWHLATTLHGTAYLSAVYWSHGHKQDRDERRHLPGFVQVRQCDWLNLPVAGGLHGKADANPAITIPGRNLAFAVLTACQELPDEVWIGALANEQHTLSTDKNQSFRSTASAAISYALSPFLPSGVHVRCPFAEFGFDKGTAAGWAVRNGLLISELAMTWSCRSDHLPGTDRNDPCGNCDQCIRRAAIFTMLGHPNIERTASPVLGPGAGREWLIRLYRTAAAQGWQGAAAEDCAPFMNHLVPLIEYRWSGVHELAEVARLMLERDSQECLMTAPVLPLPGSVIVRPP
jgi:7-cyano-7-deazaguanine synthase in queuosine biosynthesis